MRNHQIARYLSAKIEEIREKRQRGTEKTEARRERKHREQTDFRITLAPEVEGRRERTRENCKCGVRGAT